MSESQGQAGSWRSRSSGSRLRWRCARLCVSGAIALGASACLCGVAFGEPPEGRVYERVSPAFKGGYPVLGTKHLNALGASGEAAAFGSVGAFSGSGESFAINPYVARRTSTEWVTSGVFPEPSGGECLTGPEGILFSEDISRLLLVGEPGESFVQCESSPTDRLWARDVGGPLVSVSPSMTTVDEVGNSLKVKGTSDDLSRVLFSRSDAPSVHVLPEEIGDETVLGDELYEGEAAHARFVAVSNSGQQLTRFCDVSLGGVTGAFDAVSQPDASTVFFSVPVLTRTSGQPSCGEPSSHPEQLFVRLGGAKTVEVSRPLLEGGKGCVEVPCPEAALRAPSEFQGASEDGSRAFFTTAAKLTGEDTDSGNDLYMATIGCPGGQGEACAVSERVVTALTQVSHDPNAGQAADVESHVLAVSPDGSHVYFVARGVLSSANAEGESPSLGAENLYMLDVHGESPTVAFIADLCSGPEASGTVTDSRCAASLNEGEVSDRRLWSGGAREAQTTSGGRFLVFSTYARLVNTGPERDADSARDVYIYDGDTGGLRRVSIGEDGLSGNGNGAFDASIAKTEFNGNLQGNLELDDRAISADGSTVLFMSAEPLSAGVVNGLQNVYAWHEGRVGMVSSGTAALPDEEPVISPSGRDVLFLTSSGLVPSDTDGLSDLYDARVGGGFPVQPAEVEMCEMGCHGPVSAPAPALVPGSATQPAGGNFPPPPPAKRKTTSKRKATSKKGKSSTHAKKSARAAVHGARRARVRRSARDGRRGV